MMFQGPMDLLYAGKMNEKVQRIKSKSKSKSLEYVLDDVALCFEAAAFDANLAVGTMDIRSIGDYFGQSTYAITPDRLGNHLQLGILQLDAPAAPDVADHWIRQAFERYTLYAERLTSDLKDATTFMNRQLVLRLSQAQFATYCEDFEQGKRSAREFIDVVANDTLLALSKPFLTSLYEVEAMTLALRDANVKREENPDGFVDLLKLAVERKWADTLHVTIGVELLECISILEEFEKLLNVLEDPTVFQSGTYPIDAVPAGFGTHSIAIINKLYIERYNQKGLSVRHARRIWFKDAQLWMNRARDLGASAAAARASDVFRDFIAPRRASAPLDELIPYCGSRMRRRHHRRR